jgi:hypothetical protein
MCDPPFDGFQSLILLRKSRLGLRSQVQMHMNGLGQLLKVCEANNVVISNSLKRSLFW